jgi:hypothetical protein
MHLPYTMKMCNFRSRARRSVFMQSPMAPRTRNCFLYCIAVAALLLISAPQAAAQWELLREFHATMFTLVPGVASNDTRLVAVHWNREVYESRKDSIYWRLLTVLPRESAESRIMGIHLSPANEIYVIMDKGLYRYNEGTGSWTMLTKTLPLGGIEYLTDVAIHEDGVLILASRLAFYRSMDDGSRWERIGSPYWPSDTGGKYLRYSPEGTLYLNTFAGLFKSRNHGKTVERVVPNVIRPYFDPSGTNNPYIVINDTTIWGMTGLKEIYTLDHRVPEWRLVRKATGNEYPQAFHYSPDGVLYYLYSDDANHGLRTMEWSSDNGMTWKKVAVGGYYELGSTMNLTDILYVDGDRVVTYEYLYYGGEVYEFDLGTGTLTHRAAPIARSHAYGLFRNKNYLVAMGLYFLHYYNKQGGYVRPVYEWERKHPQLTESNRFYWQPWYTDESEHMSVLMRAHPYLDGHSILRCGGCNFIVTRRGDVVTVGSGISRYDSLCTSWTLVSSFQGCHMAINRNDQFINADKLGEFEYHDANDLLLSKGRLEPYMDSVRSIQNDTRGNLVFLGMETAYYSEDYGLTWGQSLLPNNGSAMRKVIVDHRDHFYALDGNDGMYWSSDGGANFTKMPIDFDSLFCSVTDIVVDEEYLYCSTSGCGVYRMTLPSLNGLDSPRPVGQVHAPINLYSGSRRHVTIDVPFGLDGATLFRMTDINGRVIYEAEYTVDIPRARITLDTESLSNGVYPFMISSLKEAVSGRLMIQK